MRSRGSATIRVAELKEIEQRVHEATDQQISLTDPDSRAMATNMRGASVAGYNVQAAFDTEHHLIVAHEVPFFSARALIVSSKPMLRDTTV
jgi:hypothetical protein